MRTKTNYERRYLRHGHVAHLFLEGAEVGQYELSLCGRQPGLFEWWLGTGDQEEYEIAQSLPDCQQCRRS